MSGSFSARVESFWKRSGYFSANSEFLRFGSLEKKLATETKPFQQCLAALALSWRKRADAGRRIAIPALDLGAAQLLVLPGEAYVEYQLAAQRERPDSFVLVAGYGEGATGDDDDDYNDDEDDHDDDECREWVVAHRSRS